jgi:hypothetical protein
MIKCKNETKEEHRTIAGQIAFLASVGRAAIDNPELPVEFVVHVLGSMKEPRSDSIPFLPGSQE